MPDYGVDAYCYNIFCFAFIRFLIIHINIHTTNTPMAIGNKMMTRDSTENKLSSTV